MPMRKFFVVDDSVVQCQHAMSLCAHISPGANIEFSHDGAKALEQLRRHKTDIALVDLEMPVMDGVELISHLASEHLVQAVVILSSKDPSLIASVGVMAEAAGLQVLGTLQKPLTEQVLSQTLCQYDAFVQAKAQTASRPAQVQAKITGEDILKGIAKNQFDVFFQPKLSAQSLMLKGVEALARWQHPLHGPISPLHFIQIAENEELINPLTAHLFDKALQHKRSWLQKGLNFNLAFNLSPSSLQRLQLTDRVVRRVQHYRINPNEITFEVTENILLNEVAKSIQNLARLRLKGFSIALDDYGSGFANAEQLSRIPANELKLDRSIINGVSNKPNLQKIVTSTISLAKSLNMSTVAEGVETCEDFQLLRDLEIDTIQGYYFAKPLQAAALTQWITSELKSIREKNKH